MADRKKLSGAQSRKRKMLREQYVQKQSGSLKKFLIGTEPEKRATDVCEEPSTDAACSSSIITNELPETETQHYAEDADESVENAEENVEIVENVTVTDLNLNDPGTWTNITDNLRQILVKCGPIQVKNIKFPFDNTRRRFSSLHYKRQLVNGECVLRSWLQYSETKDAVFCFCCKLFKKTTNFAIENEGYKDWKNIVQHLSRHEKSINHIENYRKWRELELRLNENLTIDNENLRLIAQSEKYWQQILERLIALVRVFARQNIAFRGTHDKIFTPNNGNFLKMVEYMSLFDPIMSEHIRKIQVKEIHTHYLGKTIQNELINLLATNIQRKILDSIKTAKYYSIILDCTPDLSHVEQMTMIVRFVHVPDNNSACKCEIKEHFLGFITLTNTSGATLTEKLLAQLNELSLPLENLRGQGYDNGSNMKGKHSGVQKRILDDNPRAFFVACSSHSLNLVVNDAVKYCLAATSFFSLVQNIYVFFSGSTQRWSVLLRHMPSLTLKPLSDTRWESRIDALRPLRYDLANILDALIDISEDETLTGPCGNQSRFEAQSLAAKISNFKFIASLIVWYKILYEINLTSKQLQTKEYDLNSAANDLNKTKTFLEIARTDTEFEKVLVDARKLSDELNIISAFTSEANPIRLRKRKRQFAYEGEDEPIRDAKQDFKVNFYFAVLDTAINSINERFQQMKDINNIFGLLFNIHELKDESSDSILDRCKTLEKSLTHGCSKDIDAIDLNNEIQAIARRVEANTKPRDVLNYILENKLADVVPNLVTAIRILLTLPVSVASGERSFSKLKLIKTYLRSTMTQERLVGLATIAIESDIAEEIDLKAAVSDFAKLKARKIDL